MVSLRLPREKTRPALGEKPGFNFTALLAGSDKGSGLEEREARWMAILISFVNNLAPGTAKDIDIHFLDSFCKSDKETWLEFRIASVRLMSFSFLQGRRQKACKQESQLKPR